MVTNRDVRSPIAWTGGRILVSFGIQEFISQRPMPSESEYFGSKIKGPSNGPQNSYGSFLENNYNNFDYIRLFMEIICLTKTVYIYGIFRKIKVHALRFLTRNVNVLETGFASPTDLIFVRYLATNIGLPNKNRHSFQHNLVTVDRYVGNYVQCTDFTII
jgi:hypothetical protein